MKPHRFWKAYAEEAKQLEPVPYYTIVFLNPGKYQHIAWGHWDTFYTKNISHGDIWRSPIQGGPWELCVQYIRHSCRKIRQSFPKLSSSNSRWESDFNPLGLRGQSSFLLPWESLVKASQSSAVAQRKSDLGFHSPPARANFPEDSSILDHWGNLSPLRWGCTE